MAVSAFGLGEVLEACGEVYDLALQHAQMQSLVAGVGRDHGPFADRGVSPCTLVRDGGLGYFSRTLAPSRCLEANLRLGRK